MRELALAAVVMLPAPGVGADEKGLEARIAPLAGRRRMVCRSERSHRSSGTTGAGWDGGGAGRWSRWHRS